MRFIPSDHEDLEKVIVQTEDGPVEAYVLTDEYSANVRSELEEMIDLKALADFFVGTNIQAPARPIHNDTIMLAQYWTDEQGRRLVHYFPPKKKDTNDEHD